MSSDEGNYWRWRWWKVDDNRRLLFVSVVTGYLYLGDHAGRPKKVGRPSLAVNGRPKTE